MGLINTTEPELALISRTASLTINCNAFLRLERGVDDVADLIKQLQPFLPLVQFFQLLFHSSEQNFYRTRAISVAPGKRAEAGAFGSHAASHAGR